MKITEITSFYPKRDAPGTHAYLVRIDTDEGIFGYGELSHMNNEAVAAIIHGTLKEQLLGQNPMDICALEQSLLGRNYKFSGQLLAMAVSGIELALWDILGKVSGQPIHAFLGGKVRPSVQYYASSMSRDLSPEAEADKLLEAIDRYGFEAVKFKLGARMGRGQGIADLAEDVNRVRVIRKRLGNAVRLFVDCNSSFTAAEAIALYEQIAPYEVSLYEEPCPYTDIAAYRQIAQRSRAPINIGEQDWNLYVIREFIAQGVAQFISCDLTKCGGLLNASRVAALCLAFGLRYVPHNTSRGLGLLATLHLACAMPACNFYQEYNIQKSDHRDQCIVSAKKPVKGQISPDNMPGWGVIVEESRLRREWIVRT